MRNRFRFDSSHDNNENLIDLTPLIDVVFVVLITFMIIAPFLSLDSIKLAKSGSDKTKEISSNEAPITIHLFAGGNIRINQKEVELNQISALLTQLKKSHPQATPLLISDQKAHFGNYMFIKGSLETAGFEKLHIAVEEEHRS
ncbi:biopolymer transporter ExbD [Candidatus Aerophobetes bacterium]|uniref:Biopolymer transporter ExbD n=1 Tax=Aerophobetes bacterium TaxID=2030807 RepID=A0A2A4X3M7_UNCAE|nr:MAG: biopolymer transporter ExbD [Candidatus Aerophobetes bacterium]